MTVLTYEVRVRGVVPAHVLAELGATSQIEEPAQTILCTEVIDQAAMHGLLARLREFGLELIEIRRIPTDTEARSDEADQQPQ